MRGWFRRRRVVQQPPKPAGWEDRGYAAAWGLRLDEWNALPTDKKRDLRNGVAAALNERNTAA